MIRDRLVVGIRNNSLSEQLQMDADLMLEKAKKAIRQKEAVHGQQSVLNNDTTVSPIDAIKSGSSLGQSQPTAKQFKPPRRHRQPQQNTKHCTRCGKSLHSRDKCPAQESLCRKCHRKGHYSNQCMSKTVAPLTAQTNPENTAYLDAMGESQQDTWSVQIHIGLQEATFIIDTSAKVTAISEKLYKSLGSPTSQKPSKVLKGPGQHPLKVVGQFQEMLHHGQNSSL